MAWCDWGACSVGTGLVLDAGIAAGDGLQWLGVLDAHLRWSALDTKRPGFSPGLWSDVGASLSESDTDTRGAGDIVTVGVVPQCRHIAEQHCGRGQAISALQAHPRIIG